MKQKKTYSTDQLPYNEDLTKYKPEYFPEKFTKEEKKYLKPFFSNTDSPLFIVQHLPEEVIGALSSRYSRSTKSLRRMFIDEYINPIVNPESQKDWGAKSASEKKEARRAKKQFIDLIEFMHKRGGIDEVVNVQRGRKFFDKWLAAYGDDSIAELGGIHMCLEGVSNIASQEIEDKRLGISPLEKSTRYVSFRDKRKDGNYRYAIPGEIKGTKLETEYKKAMDLLFDTYNDIADPYLDYVKTLYPQSADETPVSFHNSRAAKRFDDIRDLLPFSTQTNVALFGNGRAFEDLINRLLASPIGELRWWGQIMVKELEKAVPSFVRRPKTERGAQTQYYRSNIHQTRKEIIDDIFEQTVISPVTNWVRLVYSTADADEKVLSAFLTQNHYGISHSTLTQKIAKLSKKQRAVYLHKILTERNFGKQEAVRQEVRFRKVPRAFENAHYLFEIWGRAGDYRDLHRHRQMTQERHFFTTKWGYDLEKEVKKSPFIQQILKAYEQADRVFKKLEKFSPELAQYAVPFGYIQQWYMNMTAREIYWMVELRTGPQGRPHYREICQQVAREAIKTDPSIFSALMVDMNDYSLARRESEKKIESKIKSLNVL